MTRDSTRHRVRMLALMLPVSLAASLSAAWAASAAPRAVSPVSQAASAVPTDVRQRPVYGPLSAIQIAHIQTLGRSVLIAKDGQRPSAEESALVDELHALSGDLAQSIKLKSAAQLTGQTIGVSAVPSAQPAGDAATESVGQKAAQDRLLPRLTRLHERRMAVESSVDALQGADSEQLEAHQARAKHLSQHVADIERDVQSALALTNDQERYTKLAELHAALKPKSYQEQVKEMARQARISEGGAQGALTPEEEAALDRPTPTLITMTQHRPQPSGSGDKGGSGASRSHADPVHKTGTKRSPSN